ncbi:MAG: recombinase family protein [Rhizobiaceae bacterium]
MTRAAIYARYSSDLQSPTSIEDQVRICRELAEREGWEVMDPVYTDYGMTGTFLRNRDGIQNLMRDAADARFEIVISEALDRISRDQEDVAGLHKRLEFSGIKIHTLSEGEIGPLHIGLKGTMNAMFIRDLASKTRRGLRGRVEQGKSGGGIVYGYDVVKKIRDDGTYARGEREINVREAAIVRRIFTEYERGISPRAIAVQLNKEGVAAPSGGAWGPSTIHGNRARGTGILNNELYIGRLIWNRLTYRKDPETGKRVSRLNPENEWITKEVPELRIVDDELWLDVRTQQGSYERRNDPLWAKNRPVYLLSHLVKCGCCGGGFALHNRTHLSCSARRNKGVCDNHLTIEREKLEGVVLGALQTHLMDEALTQEFCKAYTQRVNELRREHNTARSEYQRELAKLEKESRKIVDAICEGVAPDLVRDRANFVQGRKDELTKILASSNDEPVAFHPTMANRYQKEIRSLIASLDDRDGRAEAAILLRSLIERIVLTPSEDGEKLTVDLVGDLAGILSIATERDRRVVNSDLSKFQPVQQVKSPDLPGSQMALVAGVGFEPTTFRL